jgi:predicted O-methyltransferase YrrM
MSDSLPGKILTLGGRLVKMAFTNPRGVQRVFGHALAASENYADRSCDVSRVPNYSLDQLLGGREEPLASTTVIFPKERFSISVIEAVSLGILLRRVSAKRVFEFGTNRGVSTTQLASNVPEDGMVFTLDLPRSDRRTAFDIKLEGDVEVANQVVKADLIPEPLRKKITFLECDSAKFDEEPYAGTMDAVFVDGAHVKEYVANDTEKGWRMLRRGGVIIWHDFRPQTPDVMQYLIPSRFKPSRVEGTTLAFAFKEE